MRTAGLVFAGREYRGLVEPPATVLEDTSRFGHDGTFLGIDEPNWVRLSSGLWVMDFDGTDDVVDVGDIGNNAQTVLAWIYPDDNTTRSIMDLDGGTHSLELDGSGDLTATGWAGPIVYVDGAVAAAVAQDAWNFIAVTTTTAFLVSDFDIGKEASFFDGKIAPPHIYNYVLTIAQIRSIFQETQHLFGV